MVILLIITLNGLLGCPKYSLGHAFRAIAKKMLIIFISYQTVVAVLQKLISFY